MHRKPTSRSLSIDHLVLGAAVRELRARRALSQERLGELAHLHRNYVGAIERGEINPTFRTLMAVAHGLDVPPSALLRLAEQRGAEAALRSSCR